MIENILSAIYICSVRKCSVISLGNCARKFSLSQTLLNGCMKYVLK